jgi:hypothetical protein
MAKIGRTRGPYEGNASGSKNPCGLNQIAKSLQMPEPLDSLPAPLAIIAKGALVAGEHATLVERPIPALYGRVQPGLVVVAVIILLFAGRNLWTYLQTPGNFELLFVLIPMAMGVAFLLYPFYLRFMAGRIAYILTESRAIVAWCPIAGAARAKSFYPAAVTEITCSRNADGSGDLILNDPNQYRSRYDPMPGFLSIANVADVEQRFRSLAGSKVAGG